MNRSYAIGDAARQVGLSVDTLRYYERIGMLPRVPRNGGGRRWYVDADLERLRFIVRAQTMDFSLAEIRQLLELRDRPAGARDEARRLAHRKLSAVDQRLRSLRHLRDELRLLLSLCAAGTGGSCPILAMEPVSPHNTSSTGNERTRETSAHRARQARVSATTSVPRKRR